MQGCSAGAFTPPGSVALTQEKMDSRFRGNDGGGSAEACPPLALVARGDRPRYGQGRIPRRRWIPAFAGMTELVARIKTDSRARIVGCAISYDALFRIDTLFRVDTVYRERGGRCAGMTDRLRPMFMVSTDYAAPNFPPPEAS